MLSSFRIRRELCLLSALLSSVSICVADGVAPRTLTLEECLRRTVARSPDLQSGVYKTKAAAHRAKQASRPLNPRLAAEVENAAGTGDVRGYDAAETTLSVSQELELGGKRQSRTVAAEAEAALSRADQNVNLQARLFETRLVALALLTAQKKARLTEQELALTREIESVAHAREKAGKTTAVETERARAETAQAEIALEARRAEQRDAVRNLALCWGEVEPTFDALADAPPSDPQALPAVDALVINAATNPELLAAEAQVRACEAKTAVERSARIPNLEISVGVRRLEESGDYGAVAGIGVELPLFTRNRNGIKASESDAEAARLDAVAARLKTEGLVRQIYAKIAALEANHRRFSQTVLPITERALALVRQAHQQGKAGYLEVLEARRSLIAAQLQKIDSEDESARLRIELNRLSNTPFKTL